LFARAQNPNVPQSSVAAVAALQPTPAAPAPAGSNAADVVPPPPLAPAPPALSVPPPAAVPPATPLAVAQLAQPASKRARHEDMPDGAGAADQQSWFKTAAAMMPARTTRSK
jgi:hypothetical protein